MHIKVENLTYKVEDRYIFKDLNLDIKKGEFVGIIGPNGSGKSTFLKNIYKVLKPNSGCIYLNGKDLNEMSNKELANEVAVLAQENSSTFDFSVKDIVLMGTYPKKKIFERSNKMDFHLVDEVLKKVGLDGFQRTSFLELSGGEKQRVFIARAMIQDTEILILDEPTNHLDIGYQIKTLKFLKEIDKTIFAALHDLNIAAKYCDKIYVINHGKIISFGKPEEILNENLIKELYDIDSEVIIRENLVQINYL